MYLKYFLESGIFAQDSKHSESRTLFYFVTDPSGQARLGLYTELFHLMLNYISNNKLTHTERKSRLHTYKRSYPFVTPSI